MKHIKTALIVLGAIFAILGGIILAHPAGSLEGIVFFVGIFNIIIAFVCGYIAHKTDVSEIRSYGILFAVLSAILGLIFLFSPSAGAGTLGIMFSFWMIFSSSMALYSAFWQYGISGWMRILNVLVGIFGLFIGFSMLFNWGMSIATFIMFIGIYLIVQGIAIMILGFSTPKDETTLD